MRPVVKGRSHQRVRRSPWWLVAPAAVAALICLLPIVYLLVRAGSPSHVREILGTTATLRLAARSLLMALLVTALSTLIGVAAAWLVTQTDLPFRRGIQFLLTLPLAVPSYVAAFVWIETWPRLAGLPGAVLVLTLISYPYVYLPAVTALSALDPAHAEVAQSLGLGRLRVALRVTVRQIRPSVAAGALLVALYALSDFGAVALMRYEVFTWVIYGAYRSAFDPTRAAVLSLLLVGIAVGLVAAESRARGRASRRLRGGVGFSSHPIPLRAWRIPALVGLLLLTGASVGVPATGTIAWLGGAADDLPLGELAGALSTSVWLASLAALACLALGVPVAVLVARHPGRVNHLLERSTFIGHALPGIVVAISMVYVGVTWLRPIYQQVPLLILGYVVLFLPVAVAGTRSAVQALPIGTEEVAANLGASRVKVLWRVIIPAAGPGIAASGALVLLTTIKELPVTLLLRPTGMDTLATDLWAHMLVSDRSAAAPLMGLIILAAAAPALAVDRMTGGAR